MVIWNGGSEPILNDVIVLTRINLASFLWGISKQHSPRRDAAEKPKISPVALKNESGLTQVCLSYMG